MKSGFACVRRTWPRVCLLLATIVLLSACGGGTPAPFVSSQSGQSGPRQPAAITPEELAAAALQPADVKSIDAKAEFWPGFPEFNVDIKMEEEPAEGERFYIAQSLTGVGESADREIQSVLMLHDTAEHSAQAYEGLVRDIEADTNGPKVGDQSIFYQQKLDGQQYNAQSTVRFQHGPIVARLTYKSKGQAVTSEEIKPFASLLDQKIVDLLSGKLPSPSVPQDLLKLLPSDEAGKQVGPVLGTVAQTPESWALIENAPKPKETLDKLQSAGVKQVVFRRYRLDKDPAQVIEIVLFPFGDDKAAGSWVQTWVEQTEKAASQTVRRLDAGKTGDKSAYQLNQDLEIYELQFAKGKYVADVACMSPFMTMSGACEPAVRSLAEAWYASLP